jgi:hypothetical protein
VRPKGVTDRTLRLIFRDYFRSIKTDAGTQRVSFFGQWFPEGVKRGSDEASPPGRLPGKAAKENDEYPYHKPTQVDEKSILRRSGDGLFRN